MKIAFCGTQNNGKTTLIENFKYNWPMYKSPEKSYREIIKEKKLSINKESNVESQRIIRDALLDQVLQSVGEKHIVFDRTILDNIVYTFYGVEKGRIKDDEFISESILLCRETMKMIDVVFWLPLNLDIIVMEPREQRDTDPHFREEIDAIFAGIYDSYLNRDNILLDIENHPPIIMLEGDIQTKINTISQYIGEDGGLIDTQESVLTSLADEYDKLEIMNKLR
jgi:GTPase SAR1 family protein